MTGAAHRAALDAAMHDPDIRARLQNNWIDATSSDEMQRTLTVVVHHMMRGRSAPLWRAAAIRA